MTGELEFHNELDVSRENKKKLETFYDNWAGNYDNIFHVKLGNLNKTLMELMSGYFPNKQDAIILDVACGTGITAVEANKVGFNYIDGTDMSDGMLKVATEKNVYRNLFKSCISDTSKLDCNDGVYDGVTCCTSITKGHLEFSNALPEFVRVTRANAIIAFTMNLSVPMTEIMGLISKLIKEEKLELKLLQRRNYYSKRDEHHECHVCILKRL